MACPVTDLCGHLVLASEVCVCRGGILRCLVRVDPVFMGWHPAVLGSLATQDELAT